MTGIIHKRGKKQAVLQGNTRLWYVNVLCKPGYAIV